jgi:hypothetical protein
MLRERTWKAEASVEQATIIKSMKLPKGLNDKLRQWCSTQHLSQQGVMILALEQYFARSNPVSQHIVDLTGQTYGHLTVLGLVPREQWGASGGAWWWVQCDCSQKTRKKVSGHALRTGKTQTCGCRRRPRTHGLSNHELYPMWSDLMHHHGAKFCKRWHSFPAFLEDILSAIGPRPKGMMLGRHPNENGRFKPGNVHWRPKLKSGRPANSIAAAARAHGLGPKTVQARVRNGMPLRQALNTPSMQDGTIRRFSPEQHRRIKESGLGYNVVWYRVVKEGMPFEKAIATPARVVGAGARPPGGVSVSATARAHGLKPGALHWRMNERGLSLEQALAQALAAQA